MIPIFLRSRSVWPGLFFDLLWILCLVAVFGIVVGIFVALLTLILVLK